MLDWLRGFYFIKKKKKNILLLIMYVHLKLMFFLLISLKLCRRGGGRSPWAPWKQRHGVGFGASALEPSEAEVRLQSREFGVARG